MYIYIGMKTQINLSVEVSLLEEVRGAGIDGLSKIFEEALKSKLNKGVTPEDLVVQKEEELMKTKIAINQKAQLYPERFKKCVRYAKYCAIPSGTIDEKIVFWKRVLEDMKKEISPAPPKEKGGI